MQSGELFLLFCGGITNSGLKIGASSTSMCKREKERLGPELPQPD